MRGKIPHVALYQWSEDLNETVCEGVMNLNSCIAATAADPVEVDLSLSCSRDKLIYIYTSGTTGMPKAAVVTNLR